MMIDWVRDRIDVMKKMPYIGVDMATGCDNACISGDVPPPLRFLRDGDIWQDTSGKVPVCREWDAGSSVWRPDDSDA